MFQKSKTLVISSLGVYNILCGVGNTLLIIYYFGVGPQAQLFLTVNIIHSSFTKLLQGGFLQEIVLPDLIDYNQKVRGFKKEIKAAFFLICLIIFSVAALALSIFGSDLAIYILPLNLLVKDIQTNFAIKYQTEYLMLV